MDVLYHSHDPWYFPCCLNIGWAGDYHLRNKLGWGFTLNQLDRERRQGTGPCRMSKEKRRRARDKRNQKRKA